VRDSKALNPQRRSVLYGEILRVSNFAVALPIQPGEIDKYVRLGKKYKKLNYLEATYMARVIDQLQAERVYVDSADSIPSRFGELISSMLTNSCQIISEHKADVEYPVVSAASIVAKVERDRMVERLRTKYGDFGSGYTSDVRTMLFLTEWLKENGTMPHFTRQSWKSWNRISQGKLVY
jgi:ribonuclease HII